LTLINSHIKLGALYALLFLYCGGIMCAIRSPCLHVTPLTVTRVNDAEFRISVQCLLLNMKVIRKTFPWTLSSHGSTHSNTNYFSLPITSLRVSAPSCLPKVTSATRIYNKSLTHSYSYKCPLGVRSFTES